ncbi:DUF448 domain-containing protein [Thiohalorhabdus sp.]|uniref:DUF448 domain-containing protein n=1 Tax=Thiohalorhabdus sp. TaxID=3094134 RepID=UPI002FC33001
MSPQRTCHACRRSAPQSELLRFVCSPDGAAVLDLRGKLPGRGAYLCPDPGCLRKGIKAKGVAQALGCRPPAEDAEALQRQAVEGLARMLTENLGHAHRAGAVVPGVDRVTQALEQGQAHWVLAASDAAERTRTWVATRVGNARVVTALTKSELGAVLGTAEVGLLAITQPRLAEKIRTLAVRCNRLKEENGDGQG